MVIGVTLLAASCRSTDSMVSSSEDVSIYAFEAPSKTTLTASRTIIGRLLGATVTNRLYKSDENIEYYVSSEDVNETFEHDLNTGNISFHRSMQKYTGDYTPQLPAKETAVAIAEEFLGKQGLSPRNTNEMKVVHYGGLRAASVIQGNRAGPAIDKLITITYGRTIDSLPVLGPGSKVIVNVGDKGEVMGLVYRWRELLAKSRRPLRPQEMISAEEAGQMAKQQIIQEYGEGVSYRILGSGRAYYDNNGRILQPVYAFETEINVQSEDKNLEPINYLCVIPMLRRSPEPLNLTAIDPRARKLIKTTDAAERTPGQEGDSKARD